MRITPLLVCVAVAIALVASLAPFLVKAVEPYALPNVLGTGANGNRGAYAAIQTSDPTLRDEPNKWVYHRVLARRPFDGSYVEIGWLKDAALGNCPTVYWVSVPNAGGDRDRDFYGGCLPIGSSWNYQVQAAGPGSGYWNLYWNDLSTPLRLVNPGWYSANEWASGAEIGNISHGAGDSQHNNVQYQDPNDNGWYSTCNREWYNSPPGIWSIAEGANCSSWRIWGNN